eukprot:1019475-Pelagomonas_calceolata.AAC.4
MSLRSLWGKSTMTWKHPVFTISGGYVILWDVPSNVVGCCNGNMDVRQTNYVEVVRIAVDNLTAFEQALEAAQPSQQEKQGQMNSNESLSIQAKGTAKRSSKAGVMRGEARQMAKSEACLHKRWLSEDELLVACKGGRGNKAGGGNGVVGLSTGPRKIYALVSKVEKKG